LKIAWNLRKSCQNRYQLIEFADPARVGDTILFGCTKSGCMVM